MTALPEFEICTMGDQNGYRLLSEQRVHDGRHVQIDECRFEAPSRPGEVIPWTVARRTPAVAVAAFTEDGRCIIVHQERLPVMRTLWEFPAGQIDDGETREAIIAAAIRELHEEAGAELLPGAVFTPLGWFFGSQGFTSEHVYLFAVGPVRIVRAPQPVGGEHIGGIRLVTPEELRHLVASLVIQDALSLALFARLSARGMV